MPNHIKNKIELKGDVEKIKEILSLFSTIHPKELQKAHNGTTICKKINKYCYGWLNEETNVFKQRDKEPVLGLPNGWTREYEESWIQFPDFDKIVPTPEILKDFQPHSGIVTAVKKKYKAPVSGDRLLAGLEFMNREKQTLDFQGKDKDLFEKGCKAYEQTGFVYWYDWSIKNWGTKWNSYSCEKENENTFTFETAWSGVLDLILLMSTHIKGLDIIYKYADENTGSNTGSFLIKSGVIVKSNTPKDQTKEAYDIAFELRPDLKEYYNLLNGNYEYIEDE